MTDTQINEKKIIDIIRADAQVREKQYKNKLGAELHKYYEDLVDFRAIMAKSDNEDMTEIAECMLGTIEDIFKVLAKNDITIG